MNTNFADAERNSSGAAPGRGLLATLLCLATLLSGCSRPGQTAAASQAPAPPFEYVDTWGSHGDGPGQFAKPVAMASDGESIIYIADAATGFVHKFSPSGEPRLSFQDDRTDMHPVDIAVDAGAAMYVADGRRGTVAIFFSDGMRHRELRPNAPSGVRESLHIAVDAYGSVFVAAKKPYGIHKFSTALRPAGAWGGAGAKQRPDTTPIETPSALAVGPDGLVYVSESAQAQIKVYDATGAPQRIISAPPDAADAQITGLAVNKKFVFAASATRPVIYIWTLQGEYRLTQDLSPWVPGAATIPRKIVVTPGNDLLLLDTAAARVFRFRLHLQ